MAALRLLIRQNLACLPFLPPSISHRDDSVRKETISCWPREQDLDAMKSCLKYSHYTFPTMVDCVLKL